MKTLPHYAQNLCLELGIPFRGLESSVLGSSRSQSASRTGKLRKMQNLSNIAHAPLEAHRKLLIYCNERHYFWGFRELPFWKPTANSSLPFFENVCLLNPKMKCPPAQQTGDESNPLASEEPAPNPLEGVVWETSPAGEASSSKVNSQADRFLAAQAQVSLLSRQEANIGAVWFCHKTEREKSSVPENCRLGKGFPQKPYNKMKYCSHYTEGKGKLASPFPLILLSHIKENILA